MTTKIGFSDIYFSALTKLDANIQRKANELVLKFQRDPNLPGLNLEKLSGVKDNRMRSLRVDQAYRVILSAPDEGGVYLFLWVDHHDDAYHWAATHNCDVNKNTGSVQIYSSEIVALESEKQFDSGTTEKRAFSELRDRNLLKLGVPEVHLPLVRKVTTEGELDGLQETLPREAFEGLFYFMAGQPYEDILREREVTEADQFDTSNFAAALERAQSLSNFMVPSDEHELNKVLNAPLEKWRVFLHPSQRKLVLGEKSGSMRVLGGAGTGKTVVAMHRAKWLASRITDANEKVLFTTFTKNLAIDIKENLASICTEEEMGRIEVINLDQWAQQFLRQFDYDYEVVFGEQRTEKFWSLAISEKPARLDLSDMFFKEEWDRVIQPQAVSSLNDYKRAKRVGRGTRLNRADRVAIWPVFEEYRSQLDKARYREPDDAYRDAAELLSNGAKTTTTYNSIIVDEAQDMGTQAFSLLRAIVPVGKNDLFICGDAHQRIYGKNKVVLSHCDIHIRGRAHKLKINYRTTDEIRKWAIGLLDGRDIDDLDGGTDDNSIYKSLTHGEAPIIENFQSIEDQVGFIKALFAQENEGICVVARTNKERDRIHELLQGLEVATEVIQANRPDNAGEHVIKLATVHRVKGLEFSTVVIASVNEGLVPLDWVIDSKADPASQRQAETEERSLVYVALTRAVKKAYLLSYGTPSRFLTRSPLL